jgi:diguanylate cyclase (GGDEF)-like protein
MIIQNVTSPADAANIAQRIVHNMSSPFSYNGQSLKVSASVGIAIYPGDARDGYELVDHADQAMYAAKHREKGTYCFYDDLLKEYAIQKVHTL